MTIETSKLYTITGGQTIDPSRFMACLRNVASRGYAMVGTTDTRDQMIRSACEHGMQMHDDRVSGMERVGREILTGLARNPVGASR